MTEQQQHLQSAFEQQQQLMNEINDLTSQINTKREMLIKLQGIVEYLQQTGVTLPQPEQEVTEEEVEE